MMHSRSSGSYIVAAASGTELCVPIAEVETYSSLETAEVPDSNSPKLYDCRVFF